MAIKDLFKNKSISKPLSGKTLEDVGSEVESSTYVEKVVEERLKLTPQVDYSDPSKFARWGSAEQYYEDAINYVQLNYPYDGSFKERIEWKLSGSALDGWVFENEYPRTTGYINLGVDYGSVNAALADGYGSFGDDNYIHFRGGPNTSSAGNTGSPIHDTFKLSNLYDTSSNRVSNLDIDGDNGVSVEFWYKKEAFSAAQSTKQVIVDISNNKSFGTDQYGRFRVEVQSGSNEFHVELASGTAGWSSGSISGTIGDGLDLISNTWTHYALTFINSGSSMVGRLYVDGDLNETITTGSSIGHITGSMIANIGSLVTSVSGANGAAGWGKLSGSIDDFRFWKTRRTAAEIGRNWFTTIGAGTNSDDANVDLGVYYKFNEGVMTTGSTIATEDLKVLDYSGRVSNGYWVGYVSGSRATGSAIVESEAAEEEFEDPILYDTHYLVQEARDALSEIGVDHDDKNTSALYNQLPTWVTLEDINKGRHTLKKLTQTLGSYFDQIHLQIEALPTFKSPTYTSSSFKPFPFANRFLEGQGLTTPEILTNASAIEAIASRDDFRDFNHKFDEIKNNIYQNIYNNLSFIYKSKGTEKAFRNLIRCYGIGDEVIRINLYGDNVELELKNNYRSTAYKKKYADFNDPDRFDTSVYQITSSGDSNSRSFVSSSAYSVWGGQTYEIETILPKKFDVSSPLYFETPFLSSSLFGAHEASGSETADKTWVGSDYGNFQVHVIRPAQESKNAYFQLSSIGNGLIPTLTSSVFQDAYNNNKWNISVRVKPSTYPLGDAVTGSAANTFTIEFTGYNNDLDVVSNEFYLTASIQPASGVLFLSTPKRFYVGAHRTNFTGSLLQYSDVKASSLRVWMKYLEDEALKAHARDASNFGSLNPSRKAFTANLSGTLLGASSTIDIPEIETLALNWDFTNVTGSGDSSDSLPTTSDATYEVYDLSSGSADLVDGFSWLSAITKWKHTGKGDFYLPYDTNAVQNEYVFTAKQQAPEVLNSDDLITIVGQDDDLFTRETRPIKHYWSVEKSMYGIINDEILKFFATIKDFNNLLGDPVERYRQEYKKLAYVRSRFFERIQNTPDLEKFVDYFKWVDDSISLMIEQLIPASAHASKNIKTMVESHILERNKYWNKLPTLDYKGNELTGAIKGINELLYPWGEGHRPIGDSEDENEYYWKNRAERTSSPLSSSDAGVNTDKTQMLSVRLSALNRSFSTPVRFVVDNEPELENEIFQVVSIKNIKNGTQAIKEQKSSSYQQNPIENFGMLGGAFVPHGNYIKDHEVIQTTGRTTNPRTFVKNEGYPQTTTTSPTFGSFVDFELPELDDNKFIFANTFAAPGGPEVSSRGSRDLLGEEFSPYNNLNWRNLNVRLALRRWEQPHTAQFGWRTDYPTTPNYHKVNRNTLNRIEIESGSYVTASVYDNPFVVSAIPQSLLQYAWISSSHDNSVSQPFGLVDSRFTTPSGTSSVSETITFISRSDFGAFVPGTGEANEGEIVWGATYASASSHDGFIPTAFVKLNLNVKEPVSSSENTLGYPDGVPLNGATDPAVLQYRNQILHAIGNSYGAGNELNALLLQRNGPYQHPTWKQIRGFEHPVVKAHRTGSILSIIDVPTEKKFIGSDGREIIYKDTRADTFTNYREPYLTDRYRPIVVELKSVDSPAPVKMSISHGNILGTFANPEAVNRLGISPCSSQVYDQLKELYLSSDLDANSNPITSFLRLTYAEKIYPKEVNTGLSRTRLRTAYAEEALYEDNTTKYYAVASTGTNGIDRGPLERRTYWKDASVERNRRYDTLWGVSGSTESTKVSASIQYQTSLPNSQGYYSGWMTSVFGMGTAQSWTRDQDLTDPASRDFGELNRLDLNLLQAAMVANGSASVAPTASDDPMTRMAISASAHFLYGSNFQLNLGVTGSVANPGKIVTPQPNSQNSLTDYYGVDMGLRWRANVDAGKEPFFDSYEDYAEDIKRMAKSFTIIPEFRISDHMEYYVEDKGGNFKARNDQFLSLDGAEITESANTRTSFWNEDFFKEYSHTDFMKHFEVIANDHDQDDKEISKITLRCNGVKKLLPYHGFYPMHRTLQLASLLSQSIAPHIGGYYWRDGEPTTASAAMSGAVATQVLLQPFFAPGILYNTIKAGIACDWASFTGSTVSSDETIMAYYTLSRNSLLGSNYRIPFEALVDIGSHLPVSSTDGTSKVVYQAPENYILDPTMGLSSMSDRFRIPYFDWNGKKSPLYELAMHNFLAEIPTFFLKDQNLTALSSRPENEIKGNFQSGTTYYMDVSLRKTPNLAMMQAYWHQNNPFTSSILNSNVPSPGIFSGSFDGTYWGPAYYFTSTFPTGGADYYSYKKDPAQAAFTPPYFYGESVARISYTADGTESTSGIINKILQQVQENVEYLNDDLFEKIKIEGLNDDASARGRPAWEGRMSLSSSINLFGLARNKQVSYGIGSQIGTSFNPISATDPDSNNFDRWVISTKMETPVLDFSEQPFDSGNISGNYSHSLGVGASFDGWNWQSIIGISGSVRYGRGMWSGYGRLPDEAEGIYLSIKESFPALDLSVAANAGTGSLITALGFETAPQKIGRLARSKEISEAIVAIPFVPEAIDRESQYAETTNIMGKHFFKISRQLFDYQLQQKKSGKPAIPNNSDWGDIGGDKTDTSISAMGLAMEKYVLPPEMDFRTYADINPFVMYVFEFKHTLDQDDLKDIWQSLMPKISMTAERESVAISHTTDTWEFYAGKKLPPNVRWMVFKVKKKAKTNYYSVTADSRDDDRFKFDFKIGRKAPEYSYNYPYDFFSLVELAEVDAVIDIEPKKEEEQQPPRAALPRRKLGSV